MREGDCIRILLIVTLLCCFDSIVWGATDPNDFAILQEFRKGLQNPELLKWPPTGGDPCGDKWPFVFCNGPRVNQIQAKNLGLVGTLPQNLNQLSELTNVGLQNNNLTGKLPSFSGLKKLTYLYLGNNQFDTIPADFFVGLENLQVVSLNHNPLNQSNGWALPPEIQNSAQLVNLSLVACNLVGPLPEFLTNLPSLVVLQLSYNRLYGEIPASYSDMQLQTLWLNNQQGSGLTGSIAPIASMTQLGTAWLNGNSFTEPIPSSTWACTSLKELRLDNNQLVGLVPTNLTSLPALQTLNLDNNGLLGPIPKVSFKDFTYENNKFCADSPGVPCSPQVTALLDFLVNVNYPKALADSWSGDEPCASWIGVSCSGNNVSLINLPGRGLNGTISPSLAKLDSLSEIRLGTNNLNGTIPDDLVSLPSLKLLNLSTNNLGPPVPKFSSSVKLLIDGNPKLDPNAPPRPSGGGSQSGNSPSSPGGLPPTDANGAPKGSKKFNLWVVIVPIVAGVLIISLAVLFVYCRRKGKSGATAASSSIVVHPRNSSDPDNMVKLVVANNANNSIASSAHQSHSASGSSDTHVIEAGNLVISVQVLRAATNNFSEDNELGRGGFGVVYKGDLPDGSKIAVKRMVSGVISSKAFDEFQAEIAVLSKVRHRNLVSLMGFSTEGNEKLLVYEYMPQGALSRYLFRWKELNLEPLSWKRRLNIALDVARGMEYLHSLAHQSFIHRDLKSSNILLDDDFRAKVADFGLVKLAPEGKYSVTTRLAGTFGYLAPEYAVTGKITTKADVFSFGVVLMELVTGMMALDEDRSEETLHLASWFHHIKSNKEKLKEAVDKSLDTSEETFQSICTVAELAGHCTAREPHQRPEMGHAVNVLGPLVEKWKPMNDDMDESLGIDLGQPLLQMVKGWQAADGTSSSMGLDDSKGSIPARPAGFAESFTSADGR